MLFQCGDGHSIFDVKTGEKKNYNDNEKENTLELGNHVWIGGSVIILRNTVIGSGAYIGAHSFVKGQFPNNTLIIGNPAMVKRSDTSWGRSATVQNINYACDSLYALKSVKLSDTNKKIHSITCFRDYLLEIKKQSPLLLVISVKDILGYQLKQEHVNILQQLGVSQNLLEKKGWSGFVFVKKDDRVFCDLIKEEESVSVDTEINGYNVSVLSAPLHSGNQSKIIINEKDYSTNLRGFNLVLFDTDTDEIVDSVCFDTHEHGIPCYRKVKFI